jgi:hypothetical protein
MEETQVKCPQCGLENNYLADACVQCGLIFVKNQTQKDAVASQDDEKTKSIEAAEAILDETKASAGPDNEAIKRPDPHEDTVEIRIPKPEDVPPLEVELSDSEAPAPEENKEAPDEEFELEAIETAIETATEPTDAESLFLSDVKVDEPSESAVAEPSRESVEATEDQPETDDRNPENDIPLVPRDDNQVSKADAVDEKTDTEAEAEAAVEASQPIDENTAEPEKKDVEPETSVENEAAAEMPDETAKSKDEPEIETAVQPEASEPKLELESESTPDQKEETPTEVKADTKLAAEPTEKAVEPESEVEDKQQAQKARNEALKKQQEALLKAEAQKKEEAAKTKEETLKKKKLTQAKLEALKKQKAAQARAEALKKKKARALSLKKQKINQAKAEALKKQKAAQAKAEASAGDVQVAAAGQANHVKLLGLLKRYKGKAIGINYENSAEIKEAELVEANEEFFSVMVKDKKIQYSYPLNTILTIVEGEQGVETGEKDKKAKFDAVIKVYPLVLF